MNSKENAKTELVARIAEIFRECGFEGASLSRITEGTGLGKGSLYHFFPAGKEEMAAEVLLHIHRWFAGHIFLPLEQENAFGALDDMWREVDDYFQSGKRVCLVGAFALDGTRDRFATAISGYFRRWIAALGGALRRAGVDDATCAVLSQEVVAGIQGALILARALDDAEFFSKSLLRLQRRVNEQLAAR
ncbi:MULTISPECIES: TetR/AcrR family transcriptional regulator [Sodalis]|uniref:TetR family transcriptional regulator n=1 Tax=Sodalis ligni TaxID=2697027 RepID=A0A4R1N952_9GAMM|nr:TetR/AcrR family transcriptional regulator [Sodalis ligni]TCL03904.1 TetR family transcriptional regulator [Sodalis ligni]